MKAISKFFLYTGILIIAGCALFKKKQGAVAPSEKQLLKATRSGLVDKKATKETAALFYNMKNMANGNVMFGHMEDNKNGYDGWKNTPGRSDVFEVTGSYPIIYGFDFGGIASPRRSNYIDKETALIHDQVIEVYKRGGAVTFSWHYDNPVSNGSFYWEKSPVNAADQILPDSSYNAIFKESLKKVAMFAHSVKYKGKLVPIIFRPFHEFDGDWFWWGKPHCTADNYKALYRYTVTYLRDSLRVHNFLYAWSPDRQFDSIAQYTERYPGADDVDVVGMDNYWDLRKGQSTALAESKLKIMTDLAAEQNKVAALTETGLENIPQVDWYTQMLLKALKTNTHLAYVMVWSNRPKSYWTPYKGHPAEADFIAFKNDGHVLFSDKMPDLYKRPGSK